MHSRKYSLAYPYTQASLRTEDKSDFNTGSSEKEEIRKSDTLIIIKKAKAFVSVLKVI